MMEMRTHQQYPVDRRVGGVRVASVDCVAEEVPVALVYNGLSHAVMLATPQDLADFALGFSLSEGILGGRDEVYDLEVCEHAGGVEVQMRVPEGRFFELKERRRALAGRTGCGLCGIESLQQVTRNLARVDAPGRIEAGALAKAYAELRGLQELFDLTGAVHAAAWCTPDGRIELVREDVGRHNALDKLIGASAASGRLFGAGFVLLTSRASYEMVSKAATVGIPVVAAISAATAMAVRVAEEAGVTLIGFARGDNHSVYSHPHRVH